MSKNQNYTDVISIRLMKQMDYSPTVYGIIKRVSDGCINIAGLTAANMGEKLVIGSKHAIASVMSFEKNGTINAILLTKSNDVQEGDIVVKTSEMLSMNIEKNFLGTFMRPM